MGADFSRIRSNPLLDFAGVELKQGGVVLDADFNELVATIDRRLRAAASDILDRSRVSSTTPDAFKIAVAGGGLVIGKGRFYVDGLLAENHGALSSDPARKLFDSLMAEVTFTDPIPYTAQPYFPDPPALPTAGHHLVYLDVWAREVTHVERPDLVEVGVGVETSSRVQIVWQVRVLAGDSANATCASADEDVPGWTALIAPSSGRLTTGTFDVPPEQDPCELPPSGGYRGLENQTYRVEIHDPGQPGGTATFKWSRDNASVVSRVVSMISGTELELQTLGRDDVLRFNTGDWVEITDDVREFSQRCGEVRQITINEAAKRITFTPALPAEMIPGTFPNPDFPRDRNLRVRRWDQKHEVLRAGAGGTTPVFQDLDAGTTGVINVPATGTTLLLENGVTVTFASTGTAGFRAGDYWVFAARTADASVELLDRASPRGIHHHYARLGFWDVAAGTVTDCRPGWPPAAEGHDCSCTACVTAASHASGEFTIQDAVNQVRETGGTVCLGVGQYVLQTAVRLLSARSVRIKGQGTATMIVAPGGAFSITNGIAIAIEDVSILSLGRDSTISVQTTLGLKLQRLVVLVPRNPDIRSAAIALNGAVIGATIRENLLVAPVGIQALAPIGGETPPPQILLSAVLHIEDNALVCDRHAVDLSGRTLHLMATRIAGNEVLGARQGGITTLGLCGPGASMRIAANSVDVSGPGITAAVDGLWIEGNKLVATPQRTSLKPGDAGIALRTGLDPSGADQCQILSNQISGFPGPAIAIQSPTADLIVKLNIIQRCGNGIVSQDEANAASVSIENNQLSDIGTAADEQAGFVVGIGVLRADAATVSGNIVRRVGQQAVRAPLSAGIAAASVRRLRAIGNDITDIAPPGDFIGLGVGVMLRSPYAQAQVNHNHVARDGQPTTQVNRSQWFAVLIDQPLGDRLVSRVGSYAAVRIDDARTLVFGGKRPYVVTAAGVADQTGAAPVVRGATVSILGNVLGARGATPVVDVVATGDCLFTDNRCELALNNDAPAVRLVSGASIVNANRVQSGQQPSIQLLGNTKKITVLGNITTGPIIAGGPLPAPWDALNVIG
jgi:hypothetical protein